MKVAKENSAVFLQRKRNVMLRQIFNVIMLLLAIATSFYSGVACFSHFLTHIREQFKFSSHELKL